jgi:hypothetical protein
MNPSNIDSYNGDTSVYLKYNPGDFKYYPYNGTLDDMTCQTAESICIPSLLGVSQRNLGSIDMSKINIMDDKEVQNVLTDYNINLSDVGDKLIMMDVVQTVDQNAVACAVVELCKNKTNADVIQKMRNKQSGDYERWINTWQMYQMYKLNMVNLGIGIFSAIAYIYNQY